MDPLNDNVVALLQTSNDPFTREIWKDGKIIIFFNPKTKQNKILTFSYYLGNETKSYSSKYNDNT